MNTGNFIGRWKSEVLPRQSAVYIYNTAPYAGVIEYGRRPGARPPPTKAIARWAQRKFGIPYKEARGIAFMIARSIGRRGLVGRRILTSEAMRLKLEDMFLEEIAAELMAELRSGR